MAIVLSDGVRRRGTHHLLYLNDLYLLLKERRLTGIRLYTWSLLQEGLSNVVPFDSYATAVKTLFIRSSRFIGRRNVDTNDGTDV